MSRRAVDHDLIAEQADFGVGQDANRFVFAQCGFAGDRRMCRLYLTMLDKLNVRLPKFGDATKPLEEV